MRGTSIYLGSAAPQMIYPARGFIETHATDALGVYVGRFFRWNSWDVVTRPWKPLGDLSRFGQKETLVQAVGFCGTFFLLSLLVFVVFEAVARMRVDD